MGSRTGSLGEPPRLGDGAGLAFDGDHGTFYAVGSRTNGLHTLDVTSGALTPVGPTGVPMGTRLA